MRSQDPAWECIPASVHNACQQLPRHLFERLRPVAPALRETPLTGAELGTGPVVYWTHHALRVDENPALDVARELAVACDRPLLVYRGLSATYRYASDRHHAFQLQSARELERSYEAMGIRWSMFLETRSGSFPALLELVKTGSLLITEDFPGEPTERWLKRIAGLRKLPVLAVDTSCVVPMQLVGRSYDRAYAFREATQPLYRDRIPIEWPDCTAQPERYVGPLPYPSTQLVECTDAEWLEQCDIDHSVPPVADTLGGSTAGYDRWSQFVQGSLRRYSAKRNDPCSDASSRMSAYLHYGMVSPMRLAREATARGADKFVDELLIWRELAYGYCFYRSDYGLVQTLPQWAKDTLQRHESDPRERIYSWERLARAQTQDRLWNACQRSLLRHGELHNNVRMTWGKMVLNWTRCAPDALRILIDLNHRYALDGRDPASYGGILWCLGQFDRPFEPESPITGRVRSRSTREHSQRLDIGLFEKRVDRPISKRALRVAVIGAGIAGLICARTLRDQGVEVDIFEKSRGPGGRAATRRVDTQTLFDHGPPYAIVRNHRWENLLQSWHEEKIIAPWDGRIVSWVQGLVEEAPREGIRWVGVGGMNSLGKHLANELELRCHTQVTHVVSNGNATYDLIATELTARRESSTKPFPSSSRVVDRGADSTTKRFGPYDSVLWNCPPEQATAMVPDECSWKPALGQFSLDPCWATMVRFSERLPIEWDGARITGEDIAWIGRESSKPGRDSTQEDWIVHASSDWSRSHLEMSSDAIQESLWASMAKVVGCTLPEPISIAVHRWRYAMPTSTGLPNDCGWDANCRLGICGDWAAQRSEGTAGIERALQSGTALAGSVLRWLVGHGPVDESLNRTETGPNWKQLELF
jgi:photolyase PhrII